MNKCNKQETSVIRPIQITLDNYKADIVLSRMKSVKIGYK